MNKIKSVVISVLMALVVVVIVLPTHSATIQSGTSPLRNVNISEVRAFLAVDKTNDNVYTNTYKCVQFSQDLVNSATERGINAYLVVVGFRGAEGHTFVAFPTSNAGIVYIDPQSDNEYDKPIINKPLCFTRGACMSKYGVGTIYINAVIEPAHCEGDWCGGTK